MSSKPTTIIQANASKKCSRTVNINFGTEEAFLKFVFPTYHRELNPTPWTGKPLMSLKDRLALLSTTEEKRALIEAEVDYARSLQSTTQRPGKIHSVLRHKNFQALLHPFAKNDLRK